MITAQIIDQTPIDTTLPDTSDPLYQVAALSLFYREQFQALRDAGFQFAKPEISDFQAFDTDMDTFLDNANQRFDEWLSGQVATVAANLPDVLSIGAAYVSGGSSEVAGLILQRILGHMFHREDSRAEHEGAQDNQAIVDKLEEVRSEIETVMGTLNINIIKDSDEEAYVSYTDQIT